MVCCKMQRAPFFPWPVNLRFKSNQKVNTELLNKSWLQFISWKVKLSNIKIIIVGKLNYTWSWDKFNIWIGFSISGKFVGEKCGLPHRNLTARTHVEQTVAHLEGVGGDPEQKVSSIKLLSGLCILLGNFIFQSFLVNIKICIINLCKLLVPVWCWHDVCPSVDLQVNVLYVEDVWGHPIAGSVDSLFLDWRLFVHFTITGPEHVTWNEIRNLNSFTWSP